MNGLPSVWITVQLFTTLPPHFLEHLAVLVARDLFTSLLDNTTHSVASSLQKSDIVCKRL
jgi:hypothetical protein